MPILYSQIPYFPLPKGFLLPARSTAQVTSKRI